MRDEFETELEEYELDEPTVWESEINQLIQQQRERDEAAAVARDFRPTVQALQSPGRVADEMLSRSRYLRSRPLRNMKLREREMLAELDAIEAQARTLDLRWKLCEVSSAQVAAEMELLGLAVFAVRGRFADLIRLQGEPFPSRAKPLEPEERRRELAEIEAFLARKKAREGK